MKPTRITITIARPDASRFQLWRDNTHWKHVPEAAAARYAFVIGLHVVAEGEPGRNRGGEGAARSVVVRGVDPGRGDVRHPSGDGQHVDGLFSLVLGVAAALRVDSATAALREVYAWAATNAAS